jgi:DNA invertase Pin-like site-specific DNA recombinase
MRRRLYQPKNAWSLLKKPGPGEGRVIGQVRYSSELQDGGYSLEEQKREIQLAAAKEQWTIVGWCEEPATSAKGDLETRPKLQALLTMDAGVTCNVIMCHESSRWTRNQGAGDRSLELLRQRQCWWQTADGQWDINKPLQEGFDIVWAITQVTNAAFIRKLSGHVKKGKRGRALDGYSNSFPMFGYRMPELILSSELGHLSEIRRRRIVYEPHPEYFPVLQRVGELLAREPPMTLPQVADELNRMGLPYWSYKYGRRPWSESILSSLLYSVYPREYAPGSGRGTIGVPDGTTVEGRHVAAWSYELCQKIDSNRALLGTNRHARPRKGLIHAFSGVIFCVHCGRPLITRTQRYGGRDVVYTYYACQTPKLLGIECAAGSNRKHCAVRTELVDQQFGVILGWLGTWGEAAIAAMKQAYDEAAGAKTDPVRESERRRTDLAKRRANLSRQHELGLLDDTQLMARLAEIRQDEAQLRTPATPVTQHWERGLEAIRAFESLGAQWREATEAREHALCHRIAYVLVQVVHFDLVQARIVGIRPKPDMYLPIKQRLEEHGWHEREPGLLWKDAPLEFGIRLARTRYDAVVEALQAGIVTSKEIAAHTGMHYNHVHAILRGMLREGSVTCERVPGSVRKHLRFTYVGPAMPEPIAARLTPIDPGLPEA